MAWFLPSLDHRLHDIAHVSLSHVNLSILCHFSVVQLYIIQLDVFMFYAYQLLKKIDYPKARVATEFILPALRYDSGHISIKYH